MISLVVWRSFVTVDMLTVDMSVLQAVVIIRMLKKQFRKKIVAGNMFRIYQFHYGPYLVMEALKRESIALRVIKSFAWASFGYG